MVINKETFLKNNSIHTEISLFALFKYYTYIDWILSHKRIKLNPTCVFGFNNHIKISLGEDIGGIEVRRFLISFNPTYELLVNYNTGNEALTHMFFDSEPDHIENLITESKKIMKAFFDE